MRNQLLVACTEMYTYYMLGDRSLATFKAFLLPELTGVVVHDRYATYDSKELTEVRKAGRRSVPPSVVATVMVLQRLEGLSHREAVDRAVRAHDGHPPALRHGRRRAGTRAAGDGAAGPNSRRGAGVPAA